MACIQVNQCFPFIKKMHHHTANSCIVWLGDTTSKKVSTFTSIKLQSDVLSPKGRSRVLLLRHWISCGLCCYSWEVLIVPFEASCVASLEVASAQSQNALTVSPCGLHLARQEYINCTELLSIQTLPHFISCISSQELSRNLQHIKFTLHLKLLKPFLFCFSSRTSTSGNIILTLFIITKCTQKASDNKVKFLFLAVEKFLGLPYFIIEPCSPCLRRIVCCWIFAK